MLCLLCLSSTSARLHELIINGKYSLLDQNISFFIYNVALLLTLISQFLKYTDCIDKKIAYTVISTSMQTFRRTEYFDLIDAF